MDTIVACSTPNGRGAIAIIRLSGEKAKSLSEELLSKKFVLPAKAVCSILDTGSIKDRCVAVWFASPHSYTGEDVVEISCHGSPLIVSEVIRYFVQKGARTAQPGEFSRRAFLNGKLDLSSAEGVIDLIDSNTIEQARAAFSQAEGNLGKKISELQGRLASLAALLEVAIDYPEEDIEQATEQTILPELDNLMQITDELINSFSRSRLLRSGVRAVLLGKPNVGKSTLLNALLGFNRAIVSSQPGTTRDTIEESVSHNGFKIVLTDTAGVRENADEIENEGVVRAIDEAARADVIIALSEDGKFDLPLPSGKKIIFARTKCDNGEQTEDLLCLSAKTGFNLNKLLDRVIEVSGAEGASADGVTSVRHYECLLRAKECLEHARNNLFSVTLDLTSVDLSLAYDELGGITGAIGSDEIIDNIFKQFCVGK